jgi:transposase-like protein
MANRDQFELAVSERRRRRFSENFKKEKVRELELGITTPSQLCKAYEVSGMSVYRWIAKFGSMKQKKERLIVESQSDAVQLLEMKKKIAELERVVGQKQLLIDFQQTMIDLAEEHYQVDIKKKFSGTPSSTTGKGGKS